MKHPILFTTFISALSLLPEIPLAAQELTGTQWTADSVIFHFSLNEPEGKGESDYAVLNFPMLTNGKGDTLSLNSAIFRGERNRRYIDRQRFYKTPEGKSAEGCEDEKTLGETVVRHYRLSRQHVPWLWKDKVWLKVRREREGCCRVENLPTQPVGYLMYVPPFLPLLPDVPDNTGKAGELQRNNPVLLHISDYLPYTPDRILRKEKGAMWVHYDLGRHLLRPDLRDNRQTLERIISITRDIMADTTSSVKIIQIIGMASFDGNEKSNYQLADRRARALKQYLQEQLNVPSNLFELANGGEGWAEFRDVVADDSLAEREELLDIIDTETDPARREQRIKRHNKGKTYRYLRDNVLFDQRNSGYLRIYYDYVPDTNAATINRAIGLIKEGQYSEARTLLERVKTDPRRLNPLGVVCYHLGDLDHARLYLHLASERGSAEAKRNLEQIEACETAKAKRDGKL